jgi:hypothetical protein
MKKRKPLNPTVIPFGFVDESIALDNRLRLLSELLLGFTDQDLILDVDAIQELGRELGRYLRSRNALEMCVGRLASYYDDEFSELARAYQTRLKGPHE